MMLSAILMLQHIGQKAVAERVEQALHRVYREGRRLTPDVGGTATTQEFTSAVVGALR